IKNIACLRQLPLRPASVLGPGIFSDQKIRETGVVKILGGLEYRQAPIEMMYGELRVVILHGHEPAYPLNASEHEEIRCGIVFFHATQATPNFFGGSASK